MYSEVFSQWGTLRLTLATRHRWLVTLLLEWLARSRALHDLLTALQYLETDTRQQEPVNLKDSRAALIRKYFKLMVSVELGFGLG